MINSYHELSPQSSDESGYLELDVKLPALFRKASKASFIGYLFAIRCIWGQICTNLGDPF